MKNLNFVMVDIDDSFTDKDLAVMKERADCTGNNNYVFYNLSVKAYLSPLASQSERLYRALVHLVSYPPEEMFGLIFRPKS